MFVGKPESSENCLRCGAEGHSAVRILKFAFEDNAVVAPVTSKILARNLNHEILDSSVPLLGNESFKFTLLSYEIRDLFSLFSLEDELSGLS